MLVFKNLVTTISRIALVCLVSSEFLLAQNNLLNAVVPQEIGQFTEDQIASNDNRPIAYGYVDNRDVLWSKTIWEKIDLNEKVNFPYYYPEVDLGPQRRSLFKILKDAILSKEIVEVYLESDFKDKLSYEDIKSFLKSEGYDEEGINNAEEDLGRDLTEEEREEYLDIREIKPRNVKQYWIKGTWYFDKRLGELRYRLLGICPVTEPLENPNKDPNIAPVPLFWIWFPDAREVLNDNNIFNKRNSAQPISFDVMLNTRRFSSIIYKEENEYEDREIDKYLPKDALRQMLESERIKSVIRDFEQDMWNN